MDWAGLGWAGPARTALVVLKSSKKERSTVRLDGMGLASLEWSRLGLERLAWTGQAHLEKAKRDFFQLFKGFLSYVAPLAIWKKPLLASGLRPDGLSYRGVWQASMEERRRLVSGVPG